MLFSDTPVALMPPRADFGACLARVLRERKSSRAFDAARPLSEQHLSELLWCACGVNRTGSGDRTAPSWRDAREMEVFVATGSGVWRYDPVEHRLVPHLADDVRALTGVQDFVTAAPMELIYVADRRHLAGLGLEDQNRVASADTGFIGQNVYLYCASEGLATVFRTSFDHLPLARSLKLSPDQFVAFVQTVGYPQ